jgi:RimJ/RimL family protein N-acetyltransferase/methionyl-tRNA formyltransferase
MGAKGASFLEKGSIMIKSSLVDEWPSLTKDKVSLRRLTAQDVSLEYVGWLNNPKVNRYLECRHTKHSIESTKKYVSDLCSDSSNQLLLGIFLSCDGKQIGTIKIGPINWKHRHASVGLMIGEMEVWGMGYGTESIRLITAYALGDLGLDSLNAGCYAENTGSYKSFLKAGWEVTGCLKGHWLNDLGKRSDQMLLSAQKKSLDDTSSAKGVSLIGGGELMAKIALYLRGLGWSVLVVYAPRHANESFATTLREAGCEVTIINDINQDPDALNLLEQYSGICFCFGPAWIFSNDIINLFNGRIFNFNGIPIPLYLGGAHFTWQILNKSRHGGAFIQQITPAVDRGPVVSCETYELPDSCRHPLGYEEYNNEKALKFLKTFIQKHMVVGSPIIQCEKQPNWDELLYYPRLLTSQCAWIDWTWDGDEIERFCNAFDEPYLGARSCLGSRVVILKKVVFDASVYHHPFCSGLIVRKTADFVYISARRGMLRVGGFSAEDSQSKSASVSFKLGDRLTTPEQYLLNATKRVYVSPHGFGEERLR